MAEQSYIFDFSRTPTFFEHFNIDFNLADMDSTTANFEMAIVKYGGDNISEYLDSEDGTLDTDTIGSENILVEDCILSFESDSMGDITIRLAEAVSFDIGDVNIPLKAIFLRDKVTGYVMGYSINLVPFNVTNAVVFDENLIFWNTGRLSCDG